MTSIDPNQRAGIVPIHPGPLQKTGVRRAATDFQNLGTLIDLPIRAGYGLYEAVDWNQPLITHNIGVAPKKLILGGAVPRSTGSFLANLSLILTAIEDCEILQ